MAAADAPDTVDAKAAPRPLADGKRRLIDAALRLSARAGSIGALGIREIGREALLNANTFYRHFLGLDELGLAIVRRLGEELRPGLRDVRRQAPDLEEAARRTVGYVFDFARRNPELTLVAVRDLHGGATAIRNALRRLLDDFAADLSEDILALGFVPAAVDKNEVDPIARAIVQQVFLLALDYVERPQQRDRILSFAIEFILLLAAGAHARYPARTASPSEGAV